MERNPSGPHANPALLWRTYRDSGFLRQYDVILDGGPNGGLFPLVSDVGITNDDMSSLSPAGTQILFSGTVTFQVDEPRLPDPITVSTSFRMLFFSDTRLLRIDTFPDIAPTDLVTVSYQPSGDGSFPSDGSLVIPDLSFNIAIHISVARDSTAQFSLSTGSVTSPKGKFTGTGSPADAAGDIALVGIGTLSDGSLGGEDFILTLRSAALSPRGPRDRSARRTGDLPTKVELAVRIPPILLPSMLRARRWVDNFGLTPGSSDSSRS